MLCDSYDELNDELSQSLDLSIEEISTDIDLCTKKLICNVVEEIHRKKKRANKDNIFKQVKHFDISYADFYRSFSDLIKENVLKVRHFRGSESVRFVDKGKQSVTPAEVNETAGTDDCVGDDIGIQLQHFKRN